nr:PREDICTED: uncharacterized protein LOC105663843 [Megachile rotundata]
MKTERKEETRDTCQITVTRPTWERQTVKTGHQRASYRSGLPPQGYLRVYIPRCRFSILPPLSRDKEKQKGPRKGGSSEKKKKRKEKGSELRRKREQRRPVLRSKRLNGLRHGAAGRQEGKIVASDTHGLAGRFASRTSAPTSAVLFSGHQWGPRRPHALPPPYQNSTLPCAQHRLPFAHIRVTGCRFPPGFSCTFAIGRGTIDRQDTRGFPLRR